MDLMARGLSQHKTTCYARRAVRHLAAAPSAERRLFARVQSLERITERDVPAGTVTGSVVQSATLCRVITFSESWV
jgi:hypothetical protein